MRKCYKRICIQFNSTDADQFEWSFQIDPNATIAKLPKKTYCAAGYFVQQ